ncbi:hypothetical protein Z042_08695 [Chania multitudinisentens RB-25]|uniref:Uncharacterized protein n=1 Tax=Chania multitudinisentens RB-25 TaxID=1441930 RepID=W0LG56_9GAMM|nr:hypothetical protein [Chania multitudinisentens]AHG22721.1 hypothetical protein Z042_08695 [Chania multitudinisentens RB-25]
MRNDLVWWSLTESPFLALLLPIGITAILVACLVLLLSKKIYIFSSVCLLLIGGVMLSLSFLLNLTIQ